MARTRSVDFLPEIFQTSTNRQFLSATLDQLVQEPKFKKIQGYVGRRVGPGVNADNKYVTETTASRADYQLEPGVIFKDPEFPSKIIDAITYPGINDALDLQGAQTAQADRLYTSEFYTWDPFIDLDKFVNYNQYYWLPGGPDSVDVFSGGVPTTDNFVVTREKGYYTFSGVAGKNPKLTLVRGGTYTFQVAQNDKETINFRVNTLPGGTAWVIDYQNNPTLTLVRGNTYIFSLVSTEPVAFYIKTQQTLGTNNLYNQGVVGNGNRVGTITFTVPQDAPDTLYYNSSTQPNMQGVFNIVNAIPGTGPGFWIQTDPGINGRIPATPNLSSRDVLGVSNNGEDLGTVTFEVPLVTAQDFYYNLDPISYNSGKVDLITDIQFNQLNNVFVDQFLAANPNGIDGITDLDGRTVVLTNNDGWIIETQFDPLPRDNIYNGDVGSFDTTTFSQTTGITDINQRRGVWQIQYQTAPGGGQYMVLSSVASIPQLNKFTLQFGNTLSNTSWYKNTFDQFIRIPLLTAALDELYYQDGTDPKIFNIIKLVNPEDAAILDVNDILDQPNYTSPNGVVFTNGLKVQFLGEVVPLSYQNNSYYVEGVGTAIKLLPVTDFITPETYTQSATVPFDSTPYDSTNYDASLNQPAVQDYITINRASPDLNAWTRSNRWFHIDVITATAEYNNNVVFIDNAQRGRRPIIEFRAGTKLFDFGTQGKHAVDIIDFQATDALSTINGSTGYVIDGYPLINGSRVIFAADSDPQVRNKIYQVEFIIPDTIPPLIAEPVINLTPAPDGNVLLNQDVVVLSGFTLQGTSYWYDGVDWLRAQQKNAVNQAPLFDVYDLDGVSFSNIAKYPSSSFAGSKLFSYAQGPNNNDPVLGFPLKYLSLTNIGDIVFDNNLYTDQFTYTKNNVGETLNISTGYVREYINRTDFIREIGWQPAVLPSNCCQRQQFRFVYDGQPLLLDVAVLPDEEIPSVQIYVGSKFIEPNKYEVQVNGDTTTIILTNQYAPGSVIEVNVLSDQQSRVAFYLVPVNLENNPLNVNSPNFTLGTARQHYESICENLLDIVGPINGPNNTRDLGDILPYGTNIVQNSSPLTLAGYFMRSQAFNIFNSLAYNSREYEQYKAQLLENVIRNDYTNLTIPQMLTAVVNDLVAGRTNINPFYWTDMLPANNIYTQTTTTYGPISTPTFQLNTTYDFTSSNYQSVLVYVNDRLLTIGYDYEVATDSPRLTITYPLSVGDVIVIQEYSHTYGTFVPATPTKLGLYPSFKPQIYLDTTYVNPTLIILGHDGSKTVAFGDFRDQLLLEFETRIYNNLKIKSPIPLTLADVVPGQFRTTDYTLGEINQILSPSFLSWIGWNKLAYQTQDYIASNEFTWNYAASGNKLETPETPLPAGAWRGIYQYFYDTVDPSKTPWEMLGFSEQPSWWQLRYGPAPYTNGNLVLWDDLAAGYVADPAGAYYLPQYARPGLQQVIPVGSEGQLLSPFDSVVGSYDSSQFQKSWVFGDNGPVEYSWRSSSAYPFAVMRLLALTRPAEFFSLFVDRDLYKFDTDYNQYLLNGRYRLDANGVQVYGNGVSKASYINFIIDYNQQLGRNSTNELTTDLANLDVRLCYRMGAFTDKQYTEIYTERSSPNSINTSLLLPNESYNLLLYKNQPFERVTYSSVIIQVVEGGYAVFGYSITNPYFEILASKTGGSSTIISAGGSTVSVPNKYSQNVVQVPYGYVFTNQTVVCDFLLSYGALLESQGLVFNELENGKILNWNQMAQEFLYWVNQGWAVGSIINLNPANTSLTAIKAQAVADSIVAQTPENIILDQNRTNIPVRDLVVDRYENTLTVKSLSAQTISFLDLQFTSYETMIVLDNVSIFEDLIYNPATGARQNRVFVSATVSAEWNGQLDAQGFILNDVNLVEAWQPYKKYAKGEIVTFKNNYWSAQTIVQPAAEFRYSDWVKSDYTKIQRGLLQNIPNKADQLANSYNTYTANLNLDNDLLAYGLIGFRPREYMTSLNLNDVSQVNLYQQFIHDKGTLQSVKLLATANLGKELAQYSINENWAIQRAVYGANANKSFIELRLNEALLTSDPSTVQVILPTQQSQADQTILLSDLWRQSYKLPNTDILPTYYPEITDTALPSAGYVNFADVDVTVFSLDAELGLAPGVLESIGPATTIWAAKSNAYDWNVYRSQQIPSRVITVSDNLNGTCSVTFDGNPGLSINDIVVIRYFDASVNGVYRILSVPAVNTVVIALSAPAVTAGQGLAFRLQTQRVAQSSDVINLPFATELLPGTKVWVDNNGQGHWEVLEKQQPFTRFPYLSPAGTQTSSGYGKSIAQGYNNQFAYIGSPGFGASGAVYPYTKNEANNYAEAPYITLNAPNTAGFGNDIEIGYQNWAVIGASASNSNMGYAVVIYHPAPSTVFDITQLLVAPDLDFGTGEFGYSVAMSQDERWLYVGAPGNNKVYSYGRVDLPVEVANFITDGITTDYDVSGQIQFTVDTQIEVVLNGLLLVNGVDYNVAGSLIILNTVPAPGLSLNIARKQAHIFTGDGSTTAFDLPPYLYTATNIYSFTVLLNGVLQRPEIDYDFDSTSTLNPDYLELRFTTAPGAGNTITVRSSTYFQYVDTITYSGAGTNVRFGQSITTSTDGRQVIIGAPNDTVDIDHPKAGAVYVYDRSVVRYLIDNVSQTNYTIPNGFVEPVAVVLNGEFLTNTDQFIDGQFSVVGNDIVLSGALQLNVGDVLEIESNLFKQVQKISAETPFDEADFGAAVDLCPTNCSIYIGAPIDGLVLPAAGSVQRNVNQNRVYGTITATQASPVLTAGDTIRINNFDVAVPASPNNTVAGLANAINTFADYGVLNGIPNVTATVSDGYLTLTVVSQEAADQGSKLLVLPGTFGTAFADLAFEPYAYTQTIVSPNPSANANFGAALFIDSEADNLVVGAPGGNLYEPTTFDAGTTYFDDRATQFFNPVIQGGAVFTYDYLPAANESILNPGKFVFGSQIYDQYVEPLDQWGYAVSYVTGTLLVGSPGSDLNGNSTDYGRVGQFKNLQLSPSWAVIRQQQPVVNVYQLNSVFMYDKLKTSQSYFFDFFDPLQGKILGAARQNINYISPLDPAKYNQGDLNNNGNFWAQDRVGEIWWDTTSVRFIDPNQDDITYASRRWGQLFPGSQVEIYQWTQSTVPPANFTGPGTPLNTTSYTIRTQLNNQGTFSTFYYFWVTGIDIINTGAGKTLSTNGIARYITDPKSSGIPYLAALNSSTVAIYNGIQYLSAADTILHINYDREITDANIHTEYELIAAGNADSFISANLYRKLQDSFCGVNLVGAAVPDPFLSPAERFGVQFRPRQSMFADRFVALQNYLTRANSIVKNFPVVETKQLTLLNTSEPEPTLASGAWDKRLANIEELTYQDLFVVPIGYRYLIVSDSTNNGLWTIYEVIASTIPGQRETLLVRVQNYDTRKYWQHIDWYLPGYNTSSDIAAEVPVYSSLVTLNLPVGSSVKVTANAQGKWEIYLLTDTGWQRVGLQDGTIQFKEELWNYPLGGFGFDVEVFDAQYFDQEPVIETRQIIRAINEELFINELAIERNRLLILTFENILSQFEAPEWLTKTSLIDVTHNIRELVEFQTYRRDNQEFVLDYIQEVKPYHTQIKEFFLVYDGLDVYDGRMTDFDSPSYFDTNLEIPQYINPVLLPYTKSTAVGTGTPSSIADTPPNAEIWDQWPWLEWFANYLYSIPSVTLIDGGNGYLQAPDVTIGIEWERDTFYAQGTQIFFRQNLYNVIEGGTTGIVAPEFTTGTATNGSATLSWAGTTATALATISSAGSVSQIIILNPGSGYRDRPEVTFSGGAGTGAKGYAVVGGQNLAQNFSTNEISPVLEPYNLVRSIKTIIRYDRYQYNSDITEWTYLVPSYPQGARVRYLDQVWLANNTITNTPVTVSATGLADTVQLTVASTAGLSLGQIAVAYGVSPDSRIVDIQGNVVTLNRVLLIAFNAQVTFYDDFDPFEWIVVEANTLSGVDRTQGYYLPGPDMPGRSLPLVIDGLDYPGVQVSAPTFDQDTGFDVGNYDINPFDNISYGPEGQPTYDPAILDAIYLSEYLDPYLGVLPAPAYDGAPPNQPNAVVVAGGAYIDTYSSHAPEELIPGAEFDTLDLRVYTRPGADWALDGHGFPENIIKFVYTALTPTKSWAGLLPYPILVQVSNETLGLQLTEGLDYTVDYVDQTVTIIGPTADGNVICIQVFELGGGNQLFKQLYNGADIVNEITVPVAFDEIQEFAIFVNGEYLEETGNYTFVDAGLSQTRIEFATSYGATDCLSVVAIGPTIINDVPVNYSWSAPITQTIIATGSLSYTLTNSLEYTNPVNLIVTVNGVRARTAAGVEYFGDGSTDFLLPQRLGFSQSIITDNEVKVYVNNIPQVLGVDYTVEPYEAGDLRSVEFTTEPAVDDKILIAVTTGCQCVVNGDQLVFVPGSGLTPVLGDVIDVITWNDTRQQDILTQVYVGPVTVGVTITENYDETLYDNPPGSASAIPGQFDYSVGTTVTVNDLQLQRIITDPNRLWVTLNGVRKWYGQDFVLNGQELVIHSGLLSPTDVVMISEFTESVVPEAMAFRIFQDMRGVQATYRITTATTTAVAVAVSSTADSITLDNVGALSQPDLVANIWGVVMIEGERIMYRYRNTVDNTISGLLRGTAGTAAAPHDVGAVATNMGRTNLLPEEFQNYIVSNSFLADGSTTVFTAVDIDVDVLDSTSIEEAVEVYVGGIRVTSGYAITLDNPVVIQFDQAPPSGVEVTVLVRRGVTWYAPGAGTPSNGQALQDTNTQAARFLRGL